MDFDGLSRLIPEAVILIVVLGYVLKKDKLQADKDKSQTASQEKKDKAYASAVNKLTKSVEKNTQVTQENLDFLKNLNGKLRKTVQDKLDGK